MFYLSAELGNLSSPGMTAPGPAEAGPPLHRASLASPPFFLPPGAPPPSALHAFKTLQKELPVSDPGTRFWSGTRTFSATPRLRRQQQNRGLGLRPLLSCGPRGTSVGSSPSSNTGQVAALPSPAWSGLWSQAKPPQAGGACPGGTPLLCHVFLHPSGPRR